MEWALCDTGSALDDATRHDGRGSTIPSATRLLLTHNPVYWPSVGGSERVLQCILEGVRVHFDRVVVFATGVDGAFEHNGIEVRPYSLAGLRRFAVQHRPSVYFPNMIHNRITGANLAWVSRWCGRTVLNSIGGYLPSTPVRRRVRALRSAARHADVVVHVDPLSTEWLTDRAMVPQIPVAFIPQGLDFAELEEVKSEDHDDYYVYAHNLWWWKCPDVFLNQVAARAPEKAFQMIASATTGNVIEEISTAAGAVANVSLKLGLDRPSYLRVLSRAAAIVSTSMTEGAQPNVMLEAGILGVPYLSLVPGQNFSHYPHVEMFTSADALVERLRSEGPSLRAKRRQRLEEARQFLCREEFGWDAVIERFRALFLDPLPERLAK